MKLRFLKTKRQTEKGFTLIELMVSLAIFAFMTAFLLAKYGNFNQNTLLTNVAFDTALTVRTAQSYGLNVQGQNNSSCTAGYLFNGICFFYPYGVHFDMTHPGQFILFVDLDSNNMYTGSGEIISTYTMNKGFTIKDICTGSDENNCTSLGPTGTLDISFRRPIPDAIIFGNGSGGTPAPAYSKVTLTANGLTATVVVQSTGEISVGN